MDYTLIKGVWKANTHLVLVKRKKCCYSNVREYLLIVYHRAHWNVNECLLIVYHRTLKMFANKTHFLENTEIS